MWELGLNCSRLDAVSFRVWKEDIDHAEEESRRRHGVEIHYVRNSRTGAVDDFKFPG